MESLLDTLKLPQRRKEDTLLLAGLSMASVSIIYSIYRLYQAKSTSKLEAGLNKMPSPKFSLPFVGHILSIGADANKQFIKWHEELGPIFQIKMGRQIWIMISDRQLAQKVLVTHGAETAFRPYNTWGYRYYSFNGLYAKETPCVSLSMIY